MRAGYNASPPSPARLDRHLVAGIGHPALAVITRKQGGDGVAFAGLLLERALGELTRAPLDVLQLEPAVTGHPSSIEQMRFSLSLGLAQLLDRQSWWMFNHVGIARAQNLIPNPVRRPMQCSSAESRPGIPRSARNAGAPFSGLHCDSRSPATPHRASVPRTRRSDPSSLVRSRFCQTLQCLNRSSTRCSTRFGRTVCSSLGV